uniref:DCC-interacting protein 13-alpha n=1 Tax=Ascaris suum TaxID=6253 RepID=F1KTZ7_ASCSU
MKTRIPLEELLYDTPQNRTLIRLFEEDTYNLRTWSHQLDAALDQWCVAQKAATAAASNLASVIAAYRFQKLPLDVASYDMPSVTSRVAQNLNEIASWMDLLVQQVGFCVQCPVKKATAELDDLVETVRPNYAEALSTMAEAEEKFAKASRKDASRRLEELNNDVFITKMGYHKLALQYCSRMNVLQSRRYSELIEPLLMLLYAFKCFFNVGHDAFRKDALTQFLTQAQQQMLSIGKEAESEKNEGNQLLASLVELSKSQHEMYYGEKPETEQRRASESVQKQGYLRIRLKSGLFTNNWEKYYVFTQGAKLMWQKADQLGGSLMLDLIAVPGTSAQVAGESVDRRFVFMICLPPADDDPTGTERRWFVQAKNSADMYEWIDVINNLAGLQHKAWDQAEEASSVMALEKTCRSLTPPETPTGPLTPWNTPVRGIEEDMATQPIQFDLLSVGSNSQVKLQSHAAGSNVKGFDVRFLGCLEVVTDQGGDAIVQPAIERVLKAREAHHIAESIVCRMLVTADASGIFLVEREHPNNVKAHFDFADVAFWSAYNKKDDDTTFGMVTRTRADKNSRPTYMCSILTADSGTNSADICKELTTASAESLNILIMKASRGRDQPEFEKVAEEPNKAAATNATDE